MGEWQDWDKQEWKRWKELILDMNNLVWFVWLRWY